MHCLSLPGNISPGRPWTLNVDGINDNKHFSKSYMRYFGYLVQRLTNSLIYKSLSVFRDFFLDVAGKCAEYFFPTVLCVFILPSALKLSSFLWSAFNSFIWVSRIEFIESSSTVNRRCLPLITWLFPFLLDLSEDPLSTPAFYYLRILFPLSTNFPLVWGFDCKLQVPQLSWSNINP